MKNDEEGVKKDFTHAFSPTQASQLFSMSQHQCPQQPEQIVSWLTKYIAEFYSMSSMLKCLKFSRNVTQKIQNFPIILIQSIPNSEWLYSLSKQSY